MKRLPTHLREPHERLQWLRVNCGKYETAADAAAAHNWNLSTYRSHENGTRGLTKRNAPRYARAYGVPVTWLLHGEAVAADAIEDEERDVLLRYRSLDRRGRRAVQQLIETLAEPDEPLRAAEPERASGRRPAAKRRAAAE